MVISLSLRISSYSTVINTHTVGNVLHCGSNSLLLLLLPNLQCFLKIAVDTSQGICSNKPYNAERATAIQQL